jgi:hypothetical protein
MWTDLLSMIAAIGFIVSSGITLVVGFQACDIHNKEIYYLYVHVADLLPPLHPG